jgi:group I intron endonuclease
MLTQLKRKKSAIYSSLIKHGHSNFKLEILEYCDKSNVIVREQAYMDLLSPEYNLNKTAGSRFGSKHSEETKRIISAKLKGEKKSDVWKKSFR